MIYLVILIILFAVEIIYFKIADKFNIIDRPNERSSHTVVTLRGGGVIFYVAALIYFFVSGFQYPWFMLGLTILTVVSFLDDIISLPNRTRLLAHFVAVMMMAHQLDVFAMSWFYLLVTFIITVGVINAYNFMDGINGITAGYSLGVGILLININSSVNFIDQNLLIYTMLSVLVFAFFNFRFEAKCFAGDVGSVAIAYIIIFAIGALIIKSGSLIYLLLLSVYGIDTVWTILQRLYLKENIFEAHRTHLYQYLANEVRANRLLISFFYGFIQLIIGFAVIYFAQQNVLSQWIFSLLLLTVLSVLYLSAKTWVIRRYVINKK